MDLGWNREGLVDLCKKHNQTILSLQGNSCQLRDGQTKEYKRLNVAPKAGYSVVIVSGKNINSDKLAGQLKEVEKFKPNVNVFILSAAVHPNTYDITPDNLIKQIDINLLEAACADILAIV
jgi:hypothetical protein